jgi:thiamine pyrophosphate-dependent acetolactate synthase large subunit-like protein
MYTTAFAFFDAIEQAGVTHCFVNLGSDHPSILEAILHGRQKENGKFPRIITCPHEVTFSSFAQDVVADRNTDGGHVYG